MRAWPVLLVLCLVACGEVEDPANVDAANDSDANGAVDAPPGAADAPPGAPDAATGCNGDFTDPIEIVSAETSMGECCGATLGAIIDGSGLDLNDQHNCNDDTGWKSANILSGTVDLDLGVRHEVRAIRIWNHGQLNGDRGVDGIEISTSVDGAEFTPIPDGPSNLERVICPVSPQEFVILEPLEARFVRLTILSGYGAVNTGLGEVQVAGIPCE